MKAVVAEEGRKQRLIETWDVLKLARVFFWQEVHAGLIET